MLWLGVNLLALLIAAARLPYTARPPVALEQNAPMVLLFAQMTAAALLLPWLFRDWTTAALVILSALPMLQLTTVLANLPAASLLWPGAYLSLYLLMSALWRQTLPDASWAQTILSLIVLGGPLLLYLNLEFGHPSSAFATFTHLTPLLAVHDLLQGKTALAAWITLALFAVIPATRQVIHR
jgi:hypothetical protein